MILFIIFFSIISIIYGKNENQQIINIDINEELPISTILFITTNNVKYRLFDSGRNHNSFVHFNSSNGHISLKQSIDREYLCSEHICSCTKCQLIIELIEWQSPYRLLKLILNIDDINDNAPIFSNDNYQLNIIENVPIGFEIPIESAFDTDLGENSRINYELKNKNEGPFELIIKSNQQLTLKVIENIDREKKDFYEYDLIAFDYGKPRQQSSTKLLIKIDDMNDNSVLLSKTYIQLHISENTPIGTELTHINATDKDIGINGKIHYSITNGFPSSSWRDYFRIGDSNGILTLLNLLDYECEQSYRLIIQVRDRGENSLSCFVTIDISIIDENDNYPQAFITFVNPLRNNSIIEIIENTQINEILAHISISDKDSGRNGEISFEIEQGQDLFAIKKIDKNSYLLIVNGLIDHENKDFQVSKFVLLIYDHGKPSKSIKLEYFINIIDLNDSPPIFNSSMNCKFDLNILKNQSSDEPLFKVEAFDFDSDENGFISYIILPPFNNSFIINDYGEVFYLNNLNETFFNLEIMAIDHGKINQLNSTYICQFFTSLNNEFNYLNESLSLIDQIKLFQYNYFYLFIIFIIILFVLIIYFFYKLIFDDEKCLKKEKTYHLYISIPRKSSFINNENIFHSQICDNQLEEYQKLVQKNNSQKLLTNSNKFSRIIQNNSPLSISSIISKNSPDELKQDGQTISLSISTGTTSTNNDLEESFKYIYSKSNIIRLAEEENIDV